MESRVVLSQRESEKVKRWRMDACWPSSWVCPIPTQQRLQHLQPWKAGSRRATCRALDLD